MYNFFIMKQRIKEKLVQNHLSEENIEKIRYMRDQKAEHAEKLKTSMMGHLSALNDGVIAIFITVMMLEIPYPTSKDEYSMFIWSILTFLVSFFIIAEFWYNNKKILEATTEADHMVIVTNFTFLASLALIPATTKWIMHQATVASVMTFGIVYLLTLLFQEFLQYAVLRKRYHKHFKLFFTLMLGRIGSLVVVNALLMVFTCFHPKLASLLYLILPILSFFKPEKLVKESRGKEDETDMDPQRSEESE